MKLFGMVDIIDKTFIYFNVIHLIKYFEWLKTSFIIQTSKERMTSRVKRCLSKERCGQNVLLLYYYSDRVTLYKRRCCRNIEKGSFSWKLKLLVLVLRVISFCWDTSLPSPKSLSFLKIHQTKILKLPICWA